MIHLEFGQLFLLFRAVERIIPLVVKSRKIKKRTRTIRRPFRCQAHQLDLFVGVLVGSAEDLHGMSQILGKGGA